jgi:hypothetical protein
MVPFFQIQQGGVPNTIMIDEHIVNVAYVVAGLKNVQAPDKWNEANEPSKKLP